MACCSPSWSRAWTPLSLVWHETNRPSARSLVRGTARETQPIDRAVSHVVQFQIIAGERRWRASRLAGLTKVPVVIKEVTPLQMLKLALIENIQRADLNPIEEALAYRRLIGGIWPDAGAGRATGGQRSLNHHQRHSPVATCAPSVRETLSIQPEKFTEGHARALIGIIREEDQVIAMGKIIAQKLNVRQTEELASHIKAAERPNSRHTHRPYAAPPLEL